MNTITKDQAQNIIENLAPNAIYSVTFVKKDGSLRMINSIRSTRKGLTGEGLRYDAKSKGLMPVYDLQLAKSGTPEKQCWRMINFETVQEIKANQTVYQVI